MTRSDPNGGPDLPPGLSAQQVQAFRSLYEAALAGQQHAQVPTQPPPRKRSLLGRLILHAFNLLIAAGAFTAYQHFHLQGQSTPALVSLVIAGVFAFAPVRALLGELLSLEGKALHVVHGIGGLGVAALALGGVVSGAPVLNHAALAPFQLMGAAQAIMHQEHPRNARQAEALRRFATSLPEVAQFTSTRNLTSPDNIERAVRVMSDLISKAQALGQTELESDPGFQSALHRVGLTLGLDAVDQGIDRLAGQPGTSMQVEELRKQLAKARQAVAKK
jgi:hypothetical protein